MEIDFEKYSVEQLFQCLEGVDDRLYPENAIKILELLCVKLDSKEFDLKELGYRDNLVDDFVISEIIGNPLTLLAMGDYWNITNELEEKISRIKRLIQINRR